MDGVNIDNDQNNSWVCHINYLSDELKDLIRNRLSSICYGSQRASKHPTVYSFKNTLKNFLKRYTSKPPNTKKGMIGELLAHVLILDNINTMKPASPFFNLEENSIKKGFDIILYESKTKNLWITEVKSGAAHNEHPDIKNIERLNNAKRDLNNRLNENNTTIWHNAIAGAESSLQSGNIKKKIDNILTTCFDEAQNQKSNSISKNVVLTSVIYSPLNKKITKKRIIELRKKILNQNIFNNIIIFSIQKKTYDAIEKFLEIEKNK